MKKYFIKLYSFNGWANTRVLKCLERQQIQDEKILSLMGHIVAAQSIWLSRIKALPAPALKLWDRYSLPQLMKLTDDIQAQWVEFVENTDNFDRELNYKNFAGEPYLNNVEMIMIHLVNHSTYHRGQIAMMLRQNGHEPVNTDFITYDRVVRGQLKE